MAELQLAPHANAIVLDDPVSSLDEKFTRKIAARLAREGLKRQVIIFTHNIAFLMELGDAARALAYEGTPVAYFVHTLHRSVESAGITELGAPWSAKGTRQRAQELNDLVHKNKHLYPDNMDEYNKEAAYIYGRLRASWESCVENDLFYGVVCRYRKAIRTNQLIQVSIEDDDVRVVERHMTKTSNCIAAHDRSKALHCDLPEPKELLRDIESLRAFSQKLIRRRDTTEKHRKEQLKP